MSRGESVNRIVIVLSLVVTLGCAEKAPPPVTPNTPQEAPAKKTVPEKVVPDVEADNRAAPKPEVVPQKAALQVNRLKVRKAPHGAFRNLPLLKADVSAVTGGLEAKAIEAVVRKHRRELLKCYRGAFEPGADASRLVRVSVSIPAASSPVTTLLNNRTRSVTLGRCVNQQLTMWPFPAPAEGTARFIVSFRFGRITPEAK